MQVRLAPQSLLRPSQSGSILPTKETELHYASEDLHDTLCSYGGVC